MSDPFNPPGQPSPPPWQPAGSFGPPGSPNLPPTQPIYTPTGGTPNYDTPINSVLAPGASPAPRRSRGKMLGALVGVVAILGAGTFAFTQLRSNDSSGGASKPDEVATKLVTAIDNEDVLGAVDLLLPGERETFRQPMIDLVKELTRLEVTDKTASLSKVDGFDITISNPKTSVEPTNVSDISVVDLSGKASATIDGKSVPLGDFVIQEGFNGKRPDLDKTEKNQPFHFKMTTVKQGGRWYLSLFYTIAESLRGDRDIPTKGITPVGASTPDGAVDNLIKAAGDLDLSGIIAGLNPNEASALQRYAPLFLDHAQKQLDKANATVKITGAKYTVTGSGDTRQVALDAIKVRITGDNQDATLEIKDGCTTIDSGDTTVNSCAKADSLDQTIDSYAGNLGMDDTSTVKKLLDDTRKTFSDFKMSGVVVDKVDGKWYVSPIGTGTEFILSVLRALDRDEIQTLINDGRDVVQTFTNSFSTIDDPFTTDDTFTTDPFTTDDTFTTDPFNTDDTFTTDPTIPTFDTTPTDGTTPTDDTTTDDTTDATDSGWESCLNDTTTAQTCISSGVQAGTFDKNDIPIPFLYPQCGLFDYYNGDAFYTDTASVLQSTIEPNRKCLLDAATADGIDPDFYTPEIKHPECFKDVNPYSSASADEDAVSAAFDCVYAAD